MTSDFKMWKGARASATSQAAWSFTNEKKYGGCRSWVKLPDPPNNVNFTPVLSDDEHCKRKEEFLALVERGRFGTNPVTVTQTPDKRPLHHVSE